ncbi:hypothetical protein DMO17_18750 [Aquipseudomonas alcaligenes]|uniref:General secretion pathway protein M n=1 Tax=Aquipseudomonas alcaligenes TaxID=43263 RepID=A0A2V4KJ24_AQUAC|nr:hypothetical protein DMO17_18750 [Pseudomonas alcaligenes]
MRSKLQQLRLALHAKWINLPGPHRRILAPVGLLALLLLAHSAIWSPVERQKELAALHLKSQQELHDYLRRHAAQIAASQSEPSLPPSALHGLVTRSATTQGLSIDSLDQANDGALRLNIRGPFDRLLQWLNHVESHGARIEEAQIAKNAEGGLVGEFRLIP